MISYDEFVTKIRDFVRFIRSSPSRFAKFLRLMR